MAKYQIIDEPRSRPWAEHLLVDPTMILLVAIFLPIVWNPPFLGRYWLPMAWLVFNGYALGSATLKKELLTLAAGILAWVAMIMICLQLINFQVLPFTREDIAPYVRIITFAIFFSTLYSVVFRQQPSFQLYQYMRRPS